MSERLGPFMLESELGRGGMGVVYRARHESGRLVALKTLLGTPGPDLLARFAREGSVLAGLDHPNLVRVLGSELRGGRPWVAFELVEGETLKARVEREGPLPWEEAVRLTAQLADGIEAVHARRVLHRDIKPDNVLLGAEGPKLADFGLLKALDQETLTQTNAVVGTPDYMAPEQTSAEHGGFSERTDVYGLAATLFFMLTGRAPYAGPTPLAILVDVMDSPVPSARGINRGVPAWLDTLCRRGMAKLPEERFANVAELRAELLEGEEPQGASWLATSLLVALTLMVVVLGSLAAFQHIGTESPPPSAESDPREAEPPVPRVDSLDETEQAPPDDRVGPLRRHPWPLFQVPSDIRADVSAAILEEDFGQAAIRLSEALHADPSASWTEAGAELAAWLDAERHVSASSDWGWRLDELARLGRSANESGDTADFLAALESFRDPHDLALTPWQREVVTQRGLALAVDVVRGFNQVKPEKLTPRQRDGSAQVLRALFAESSPLPDERLTWTVVQLVALNKQVYAKDDLRGLWTRAAEFPLPNTHSYWTDGMGRLVVALALLEPSEEALVRSLGRKIKLEARVDQGMTLVRAGRAALAIGDSDLALELVEGLADSKQGQTIRWHAGKVEAQAHWVKGTLVEWIEERKARTASVVDQLLLAVGHAFAEQWTEAVRIRDQCAEVVEASKGSGRGVEGWQANFVLRGLIQELNTALNSRDPKKLMMKQP